jgi:hypothetical protein
MSAEGAGPRIRFMQRAPEGSVFHRDAFAGSIGEGINITIGGVVVGWGKILTAEVSEDGKWAELELEVET